MARDRYKQLYFQRQNSDYDTVNEEASRENEPLWRGKQLYEYYWSGPERENSDGQVVGGGWQLRPTSRTIDPVGRISSTNWINNSDEGWQQGYFDESGRQVSDRDYQAQAERDYQQILGEGRAKGYEGINLLGYMDQQLRAKGLGSVTYPIVDRFINEGLVSGNATLPSGENLYGYADRTRAAANDRGMFGVSPMFDQFAIGAGTMLAGGFLGPELTAAYGGGTTGAIGAGATLGAGQAALTGGNIAQGALVGGAAGGVAGMAGPGVGAEAVGPYGGFDNAAIAGANFGTAPAAFTGGFTGTASGNPGFSGTSYGTPGVLNEAPKGTVFETGYFPSENTSIFAPSLYQSSPSLLGNNTGGTRLSPNTNSNTSTLNGVLSNPAIVGAGLGALAGGLGGSSKPAGSITVEEGVPDWLMPYVQPTLNRYSTDVQNYNVDPYGIAPAAMQEFKNTVAGMYLSPESNKYLEDYFRLGAERVRGSLSPSFGHMQAFGGHSGYNEALSRGLGDLAVGLYGGAYERERDRQNQLIAAAPAFLGANTEAAFSPYNSYLSAISGLGKKKEQPYFSGNTFGNILGGAMFGYGLGGSFK